MTSHAVATTEDRQKPAAPMKAGGGVQAFTPRDAGELMRLAGVLAKAGDMVPQAYRGNPDTIAVAIMRGAEVGLAPMQALSSIAVINGRASLWGDALAALMQRAGHHIDTEIEGEGAEMVATATLTRGDTGKSVVRRFSMADAKRAGLAGKQGPWQQYPQRMLMMRARAWAIRDGAADALMGLQVAEEAADYGPDRARDVTPRSEPLRGGVAYIDPEPAAAAADVDEIHEVEAVPVESADARPSDDEIEAAMRAAQGEILEKEG